MFTLRLTLCAALLGVTTGVHARQLILIPAPNLESEWLRVGYSGIHPTSYEFSEGKLNIRVNKSASPLVYPLQKPAKLKKLHLKGHLLSLPDLRPNKDDFVLRVGPALEGQKQLNAFQRMMAPKWITELYNLARASERKLGALDLSLIALKSSAPNWKRRQHPDTDLIFENIALEVGDTGPFELHLNYSESLPESLGIWIGSDGDNSRAKYTVRIDELRLQFYDGDK